MKKLFKKPIWAISLGAVIFSLIFGVSAAFAITTSVGYAANTGTIDGLDNENIGLSYSGDKTDTWSANGTTITGAIQSSSGCGTTHYSSTLTLTNKRLGAATLSFDYAVDSQGGTIQIDGNVINANGTYSKELQSNGTAKIYIKSNSTSAPTKITMTNVSLAANVMAKTTFLVATNGTYKVDGDIIAKTTEKTKSGLETYSLEAIPNNNFGFVGWYCVSNSFEKYISYSQNVKIHIEEDCSLEPVFSATGTAQYETNDQVFEDFDKAMEEALKNETKLVTLLQDGSLTGSHEIPAGVTFLLPGKENEKVMNDAPDVYTPSEGEKISQSDFKAYKTLTLAADAQISVSGSLYVGGKYTCASGSKNGYMAGGYGILFLENGSNVTVEANGVLYAWGFVSGGGIVEVKASGKVYEWFQILDFRGGTATMSIHNKVFPFSQYGVQNVETPLTIYAGASEIVYTGVYASSKINPATISFIGDDGFFKLVSGSLTKRYDYTTDRIEYLISGEAEVNNLALSLTGPKVDSKDYVFPITNNMTVQLIKGKLTVNQALALLAGVEFDIGEGAEAVLSSGQKMYVYDRDEWIANDYTCKGKWAAIKNVPFSKERYQRKEEDLVDTKIDICGTLTAEGEIYTTQGGAEITSSNGKGIFVQKGKPGTETKTYQYTQSRSSVTSHDIPITAAKLQNSDRSYFETSNVKTGTNLQMNNGMWGEKPAEVTVTYHLGTGKMFTYPSKKAQKVLTSQEVTGDSSTKNAWAWSDEEDFSSDILYVPGESAVFASNTDLYPVFSGWVNSHYFFDETLGRITGFYHGLTPNGDEWKTMWFDQGTGKFDSALEGVEKWQGEFYYVLNGCSEIPSNGWYRESSLSQADKVSYYYFGNKPIAYRDITTYVDTPCEDGGTTYLPKGWYTFSKDGFIEKIEETIDPKKSGQAQITTVTGLDYCLIDGVKAGIGLFESDGYVYYAQKDASLFKDGTLFVPNANGITGNDKKTVLVPGLYVFNEKGQMLDGDYQLIHKA